MAFGSRVCPQDRYECLGISRLLSAQKTRQAHCQGTCHPPNRIPFEHGRKVRISQKEGIKKAGLQAGFFCGAKDGIRTRDPDLGKVVLYQLSYFRVRECKYTTNSIFTKISWDFLRQTPIVEPRARPTPGSSND